MATTAQPFHHPSVFFTVCKRQTSENPLRESMTAGPVFGQMFPVECVMLSLCFEARMGATTSFFFSPTVLVKYSYALF